MSQPKQDRFALYNANQKKNPPLLTDYPRMLTNEDGSTSIVQDEDEHVALVGSKKFESESFWGPSAHTAPQKAQLPQEPEKMPEVNIDESMRRRKGSRTQNLDGQGASIEDLIPAQTVFTEKPPLAS